MSDLDLPVIPASQGTHIVLEALDAFGAKDDRAALHVRARIASQMVGDRILQDYGATQAFVLSVLPHFWITSTLRGSRASVTLGPDYNSASGEKLKAVWPEDLCHNGWNVEVERHDQPAQTRDRCLAAILAMIKACRAGSAYASQRPQAPPTDAPDRLSELKALYEAVLNPDYDTVRLSARIDAAVLGETDGRTDYFGDIQAAENLVRRAMPGMWVLTGLCFLSGDGTIGPETPTPGLKDRYDEDILPDSGDASPLEQSIALLRCLIAAQIDLAEAGSAELDATRPAGAAA